MDVSVLRHRHADQYRAPPRAVQAAPTRALIRPGSLFYPRSPAPWCGADGSNQRGVAEVEAQLSAIRLRLKLARRPARLLAGALITVLLAAALVVVDRAARQRRCSCRLLATAPGGARRAGWVAYAAWRTRREWLSLRRPPTWPIPTPRSTIG